MARFKGYKVLHRKKRKTSAEKRSEIESDIGFHHINQSGKLCKHCNGKNDYIDNSSIVSKINTSEISSSDMISLYPICKSCSNSLVLHLSQKYHNDHNMNCVFIWVNMNEKDENTNFNDSGTSFTINMFNDDKEEFFQFVKISSGGIMIPMGFIFDRLNLMARKIFP